MVVAYTEEKSNKAPGHAAFMAKERSWTRTFKTKFRLSESVEPIMMVLVTMKFDEPAAKIMFQVTQIVRFLLERGLRFRNLVFCGNDLM